jgi:nucleotide-binding universal stress UspA family protein
MINKIVVGTDTSAAADLAVQAAADLARAHAAEMLVVYVHPQETARDAFDPKKAPDPVRYLGGIPGRFPGVRTRTHEATGDPAETISRVATEEGADVIVVGNRGTHGKRRSFLSSVPGALVRQAPMSVLVVDTRVAH